MSIEAELARSSYGDNPAFTGEVPKGGWTHEISFKIMDPGTPEHEALHKALTEGMGGDKPTEKVGPSGLTAKRIEELIIATGLNDHPLFSHREMVRRVIDGLITSGELRVVQKAEFNYKEHDLAATCSECGYANTGYDNDAHEDWNYCPKCGTEIVKTTSLNESSFKLSDAHEAQDLMGGGK